MRVGLFGGTFDPIHLGHLIMAEEARRQLRLEQVVFMPAGQPWLKADRAVTDGRHRLAMARLATADNPQFCVGADEVERSGLTYTVDTLRELRRKLGEAAEVFFILGLDALAHLDRWKEPERVIKLCHLAAVARPGYGVLDWPGFFARFPQAAGRVTLVPAPLIEISGTEIRRRVAAGEDCRYLVPAPVADYIRREGLYRNSSPDLEAGE